MFKKLSTAAAAAALLLSGTAHAATSSAQALSLRNAPVERVATPATESSQQMEGATPLFIIGGIIAIVAVLELTGAINIFGDDSDSP